MKIGSVFAFDCVSARGVFTSVGGRGFRCAFEHWQLGNSDHVLRLRAVSNIYLRSENIAILDSPGLDLDGGLYSPAAIPLRIHRISFELRS